MFRITFYPAVGFSYFNASVKKILPARVRGAMWDFDTCAELHDKTGSFIRENNRARKAKSPTSSEPPD